MLLERRDVAVHREDRVGDDQRAAPPRACAQAPGEVLDVAVVVDEDLGARQPAAVDDRGVVELVGEDDVAAAGERGDDAGVGQVARAEQQRGLGALERRPAAPRAGDGSSSCPRPAATRRRRRPSASPRRPPPRARAGGRPGRGSCSSTAAAPAGRRAARAAPAGRSPAASGGSRPPARGAPRAAPAIVDHARVLSPVGCPRPSLGAAVRRPARAEARSARRRDAAGPCLARSAAASTGPTGGSSSPPRRGSSAVVRWSSSTTSGVSPSSQPERLSGRGLAPLSGWRATFRPSSLEHLAVLLGRVAERGQEVAHHHAVEPGLDGQPLQLAEVLDAPAAEAEQRVGEDQAEDRDPLDRLPRVHVLAVAELRARARVEQVDRHRRGVDLGQLEGHLDALLARLAEVEDAADAGLEAGLRDRVDRAQAALVADRRGDLGVVGLGGLDVVVDALDARPPCSALRAGGGDVPDRRAALEVRVLGDEPRALEAPSRSRAWTAPGPG